LSFRKSAVAILVARDAGELRVLVGLRSPRSRFLGGFVAFPGGVHERQDGDLEREGEEACLRRTAARELREETGIQVAPEEFVPAGRRQSPPFTPVRFDSLMFVAFRSILPAQPSTPELEDVAWKRPADLVRRFREMEIRIAPPVLPLLAALAEAPASAPDEEIARALVLANTFPDDVGPRIEFVPDVFLVPQRTPTLLPATTTNCYLVGRGELLVIDPGSKEPDECTRLRNQLALREGAGATARAIVLTHHHADHVGGALDLARERGLEVWAHPETFSRWSDADDAAKGPGIRELADDDAIPLSGGERMRVLHTPGHAPGHVAMFEEMRGSLFAGDLVSGISTVLIDAGAGSLDRYLGSIRRLRDLPARTLFPAHGPPMTDPPRALQAVLDHRAEREARILAALADSPRSLDEIVARAYADTPDADPALAARQASAHLARLEERGRVRRAGGRWGVARPA
jgi:glyoxylase-like metal-dependent hydrolase (beta-lactamase superfamily II)/8-oxo-dGTP pyrophosphatase MutT (NUDIX family)